MSDDPAPLVARIPAGEFIMGADEHSDNERPSHRVYLDEFYLGVHAVTNEEYANFVRATDHPSPTIRNLPTVVLPDQTAMFLELAAPFVWTNGNPPDGRARHPVTLVTFEDAVAYCAWLASTTDKPFRLPTEAEWEKAARGGLERQRFPWGNEIDPTLANYLPHSNLKGAHSTKDGGEYVPNGYKLYGMAGNVWQWVSDWYAADYYAHGQYLNPPGPETGQFRVVRGGSWVNDDTNFLRCAYRHAIPIDSYSYSIGFRVAYSQPADAT
jgi:formylglycine-generating enzyme required for sulfatase activity